MPQTYRRIRLILSGLLIVILLSTLTLILSERRSPGFWLLSACAVLLGIFLVRWHARRVAYTCPDCGTVFRVTAWADFLAAHTPEKKLLRCPHCGATGWCPVKW